jgi:predicted esterase YcpF (UPF0227 family)
MEKPRCKRYNPNGTCRVWRDDGDGRPHRRQQHQRQSSPQSSNETSKDKGKDNPRRERRGSRFKHVKKQIDHVFKHHAGVRQKIKENMGNEFHELFDEMHKEVVYGLKQSVKDRLLTHEVVESVKQHKYARLSNVAYATYYHGNNSPQVKKTLEGLPETRNFKVDHALTNRNATVLHDPTTGEAVIAYRGTDPRNYDDIYTDAMIAVGKEHETKRFKDAEKLFHRTATKYGRENISLTGHSLGGGQALHVGELHDIKNVSYNPGMSPRQIKQGLRGRYAGNVSRSTIYRTHLDPVSVGTLIATPKATNRELVHVHASSDSNYKQSHELERHFYDTSNVIERDGNGFKVKKGNYRALGMHVLNGALDGLQVAMSGYDAIEMEKEHVEPHQYANKIIEDFQVIPGFEIDPEYRWNAGNVPEPVRELSNLLKTHERRMQDKRMSRLDHIANVKKGRRYKEVDDELVDKHGVVYKCYGEFC